MTVSKTTSAVKRVGNGSATVFSFPFTAAMPEDVKVAFVEPTGALTPVNTAYYSVSLASGVEEGSVTLALPDGPLASGKEIYIYRETPATQQTAITGQVAFNPIIVESVWDKFIFLMQEVKQRLTQAYFVPDGDDPQEFYQLMADLLAQAQQSSADAQAAAEAAAESATFTPTDNIPFDTTQEAIVGVDDAWRLAFSGLGDLAQKDEADYTLGQSDWTSGVDTGENFLSAAKLRGVIAATVPGWGGTYTDVKAVRPLSTWIVNSTGKPMGVIAIGRNSTASGAYFRLDNPGGTLDVPVAYMPASSGTQSINAFFLVPPGWKYRNNCGALTNVDVWMEVTL